MLGWCPRGPRLPPTRPRQRQEVHQDCLQEAQRLEPGLPVAGEFLGYPNSTRLLVANTFYAVVDSIPAPRCCGHPANATLLCPMFSVYAVILEGSIQILRWCAQGTAPAQLDSFISASRFFVVVCSSQLLCCCVQDTASTLLFRTSKFYLLWSCASRWYVTHLRMCSVWTK